MNRPQFRTIVLLGLAAFVLRADTGQADPAADIARVEENLLPSTIIADQPAFRLQERMDHYRVPGLSIAVIEDFEVQWVAHYGLRRVESDLPVGAETIFNVGSLSKAVASACILNLVDDGLVDLNGDVNLQLTSWQIPGNAFTAEAPVTPLLMMNHSAGLPRCPPYAYIAEDLPTTLQVVKGEPPSRSRPLEVFQTPGKAFQYSNGGFTVLQILAEDVTGVPFDALVRQQVFAPLGLERATFTTPLPAPVQAVAATGHGRDGQVHAVPQVWMPHTAAGGLWITAEDYARFVVELQRTVTGRSDRLFSRELATEMLSSHASVQYGLGVFLYEGNGEEPYFSHIGDGPGFVGGFTAHRTGGFGAVVLTNGAGGINLCREVLRSASRVYGWPGHLPPVRHEMPMSADEVAGIRGRYRLGLDAVVALDDEDGFLRVTGEDLPGLRLYRVAADTFVCQERRGELVVAVDPAGGMARLDLHLSDEIGRLGADARRGHMMGADERTPLETLLGGDYETASAAYLAYQGEHPDDGQIAESRFNRLGYTLLAREDVDGAVTVFRLNVALYPRSANVYDSYGEGLMAAGRREQAIANYRRSLELNPGNDNAAKILEELGVGREDS